MHLLSLVVDYSLLTAPVCQCLAIGAAMASVIVLNPCKCWSGLHFHVLL